MEGEKLSGLEDPLDYYSEPLVEQEGAGQGEARNATEPAAKSPTPERKVESFDPLDHLIEEENTPVEQQESDLFEKAFDFPAHPVEVEEEVEAGHDALDEEGREEARIEDVTEQLEAVKVNDFEGITETEDEQFTQQQLESNEIENDENTPPIDDSAKPVEVEPSTDQSKEFQAETDHGAAQDEEGLEFDESDVCVVIDFGSGTIKAGLSTDEAPTLFFPSLVGRPRAAFEEELTEPHYVGARLLDDEFARKLCLYSPIHNGVITDFEEAELIFRHIFEALNVDPTQHPVVLTEPPQIPLHDRERLVEMMFEVFGVPALSVQVQGLLALLGSGRTTGIVLDSGNGVTHTVPVFDGVCFGHAICKMNLSGHDLSVLLAKLLSQNGNAFTTTSERQQVDQMKENCCYVSQDPFGEEAEIMEYQLPNGRKIELGDERWKTPEVLFAPGRIGLECDGVHSLLWNTILKCSLDVRKSFLKNIMISGGTTLFPGFAERLEQELKNMVPTATASMINIIATADRRNAVWNGGQVVASLRSMTQDQWISREEFDEYGPQYVHEVVPIKYS